MEHYIDVGTQDPAVVKHVVFKEPIWGQSGGILVGPSALGINVKVKNPDDGQLTEIILAPGEYKHIYATKASIHIATQPLILPTNGQKKNGR